VREIGDENFYQPHSRCSTINSSSNNNALGKTRKAQIDFLKSSSGATTFYHSHFATKVALKQTNNYLTVQPLIIIHTTPLASIICLHSTLLTKFLTL
jgi:hypothetical protein